MLLKSVFPARARREDDDGETHHFSSSRAVDQCQKSWSYCLPGMVTLMESV